jgi:hypothetical protein
MKTSQAGSKLALAVTRRKFLMPLRRVLEGKMMESMRGELEDIPEPVLGKRKQYYHAVSNISAKTIGEETSDFLDLVRIKAGKGKLNVSADKLIRRLRVLRQHLEICARAHDQTAYASFMARGAFNMNEFINAMGLFCRRESIPFQRIDEQTKRARNRLMRLSCNPSINMRKMIRLLQKHLPNAEKFPEEPYQVAVLLGAKRMQVRKLLEHDQPEVYEELKEEYGKGDLTTAGVLFMGSPDEDSKWNAQRDMVYLGLWPDPHNGELIAFNESFRLNGIKGYIAADPKNIFSLGMEAFSVGDEIMIATRETIQHELQHIFDNFALLDSEMGKKYEGEMRAYLGELAFSEDQVRLAAMLMNGKGSEEGRDAHEVAWAKLKRLIKKEDPKSTEQVVSFAKRLLNEAYKQACGLTYEQIIEPFKDTK